MPDTRTVGRLPVYTVASKKGSRALMMGRSMALEPAELARLCHDGHVLATRVQDAVSGVHQEVEHLGRSFFEELGTAPGQIPDRTRAVVFVAPTEGDGVFHEWLRLEALPWETLRDPIGPIAKDRGVVRSTGEQAPAPQPFGTRRLKVLVVRASPRGVAVVPDSVVLEPLREVIAEHPEALQPRLEVLDGPDTLGQLAALLQREPDWDIVHLAMHAVDRQRLQLEDPAGHILPFDFEDFAGKLAGFREVRLFVLGVCGSSPLAVRLSRRHPTARILALLHDTSQGAVQVLVRTFYAHLLGRSQDREAVFVEDAFRAAVSHLNDERFAEWFLPVLYGPEGMQPMLDVREYQRLRTVLQVVESGRLAEARGLLAGLRESPQGIIRDIAHDLEQEVTRVEHATDNLRRLDRDLEDRACRPREGGWDTLHRCWGPNRDITQPATMGAGIVSTAPTPRPRFTARILAAYQAQYRAGATAIQEISGFYDGDPGRLLTGFEQLDSYGALRANERLQAAAPTFLKALLEDLLARGAGRVAQIQAAGRVDRAGLLEAVLVLREVERGLHALRQRDPDANSGAELGKALRAAVEACALLVEGWDSAPVPAGMLARERHLELFQWVCGDGPTAQSGSAPRDLTQLITGLHAQEGRQAGGADMVRASALDEPSLVANAQAPIRLALDLQDARQPFLELFPFGVSAACTQGDLKNRASYDIGALADGRRRDELHHSLDSLLDERARLRLEATLLPSENPRQLSERLHPVVVRRLRGEPLPSDLFEGLGPLDRAALMALAGQVVEASEALWNLAQSDAATFEQQHAAFLLLVHRAWRQRGDPASFMNAGRRAVALLGRLCVPRERSGRWVSKRLQAWTGAMPMDLGERQAAFREALEGRLEAVLERVGALGPEHATLATVLQLELRAEFMGAELLEEHQDECGGYLGALYAGELPRLARIAANTFAYISTMDREEFQQRMIATGESRERFLERIFLLSELRRAWASPSSATAALLDPLLPSREDLEAGAFWPPDSLLELMREESFAYRFPFHHLACEGDPQLLMTHAAMVAARCHLESARALLLDERVTIARLSAHLDRVRHLARLVECVGSPLGGEPACAMMPRVEGLLTDWMKEVREEFFQARRPGGDRAAFNQKVKALNQLLKRLARRYADMLGFPFSQLQSDLLLCEAVYYLHSENDPEHALQLVDEAWRLHPGNWEVAAVFIDAEVLRANTWEMAGEVERARSELRSALVRVRRWLEQYTRPEIEERAQAMADSVDDPRPASSLSARMKQLQQQQQQQDGGESGGTA